MIATRADLHRLVDALPADQLNAAARALEQIAAADPVLHALLTAPEDDEPLTPEEEAAIAEAREDIRAGRVVRLDDIRDELLGK